MKREQLTLFLRDVLANRSAKCASTALVYGAIAAGVKYQQRCDPGTYTKTEPSPEKYFEYAVFILGTCPEDADVINRFKLGTIPKHIAKRR